MTHDQHKTRLVEGGLSGSSNVANDAQIIDHFYLNSKAYLGPECGYNGRSYKPKQYPRTESVFFNAPNHAGLFAHTRTGACTSLGDAGSGNAPTVFGSRTSPAFIGGSKILKPKVFTMNKSSKSQKSIPSIQHAQIIDDTPALERLCTVLKNRGIEADSSPSGGEFMLDFNVFAFDATENRAHSTLMNPDGTVYLSPDELYDLRHVFVGMMAEHYEAYQLERLSKDETFFDLSCFVGTGGYGVGHFARVGWYQISVSLHPLACDANWWAKNVDQVFSDIRQEYIEAINYINARPQMYVERAIAYAEEQKGGEA